MLPTTSPPPDTISDKILCALLNPHEVDLPDLAYRIGISLRELADIASSESISKTMATFADLFCARSHLIACQFSARTVSALCDASATITPDDRDASPSVKAHFLETARKSSNAVIKLAIPEKCLPEYHRNQRLAALAPPMQNPADHAGSTPHSVSPRHNEPPAPSSPNPLPLSTPNPHLAPASPAVTPPVSASPGVGGAEEGAAPSSASAESSSSTPLTVHVAPVPPTSVVSPAPMTPALPIPPIARASSP